VNSSTFNSKAGIDSDSIRCTEVRLVMVSAVVVATLALGLAPWLHHWIPTLIHLQAPRGPVSWRWDGQTCLLAFVIALPLVVWTLVLQWECRTARKLPRWCSWFFAFCLVIAASAGSNQDKVSWFFLEAVKVRAAAFSYPRAVAFWKAENLKFDAQRVVTTKPQILLLGSSQLNFAIEADRIAEARPGFSVRKKALPGFNAMSYQLAVPELNLKAGDVVVCWLSEFDFFREDRVPANRLRSSSVLGTVPSLVRCLDSERAANVEPIMDLTLAGVMPVWRLRDLHRTLVFNFWWREKLSASADAAFQDPMAADITKQGQNLARSVRRGALVDANFNSFETFAETLTGEGIHLLVVEGQSHPISRQVYDPAFRGETRERLETMATQIGFEYRSEDMLPNFSADDFADVYHLNSRAMRRFSDYLITQLPDSTN